MPEFPACTQILWSKLWITRARLLQPLTAQGLQATDHFLPNPSRTKIAPFQALCPEVVPVPDAFQIIRMPPGARPKRS
jgi:hypothetical protein